MTKKQIHWLVSCEHASSALPERWAHIFDQAGELLDTHRGWDPGSLELAEAIADALGVKPYIYSWSRLLIEPNRSQHHPKLFSEISKNLMFDQKKELIDLYWSPYRNRIRNVIHKEKSSQKRVIHISVHTFIPVWDGAIRNVDIGLLYDPGRNSEQQFCRKWKSQLEEVFPDFKIRMNQPYSGSSDGLTTALRKEFTKDDYTGVEIEINQKYWYENKSVWKRISEMLADSVRNLSELN
ncbi:N-formylglutamate amidohydrolase [soil metagenome]